MLVHKGGEINNVQLITRVVNVEINTYKIIVLKYTKSIEGILQFKKEKKMGDGSNRCIVQLKKRGRGENQVLKLKVFYNLKSVPYQLLDSNLPLFMNDSPTTAFSNLDLKSGSCIGLLSFGTMYRVQKISFQYTINI